MYSEKVSTETCVAFGAYAGVVTLAQANGQAPAKSAEGH
jgi:hypothetical protein